MYICWLLKFIERVHVLSSGEKESVRHNGFFFSWGCCILFHSNKGSFTCIESGGLFPSKLSSVSSLKCWSGWHNWCVKWEDWRWSRWQNWCRDRCTSFGKAFAGVFQKEELQKTSVSRVTLSGSSALRSFAGINPFSVRYPSNIDLAIALRKAHLKM